MGEGPRGSNGAHSTFHRVSATSSASHNQIGPLWCWFPSGWACAHSRPLWVSPTTSPVRLGVSPAAAPTPTGVFNRRFEALFPPPCWSPGLYRLLCSLLFVRFIYARMWGFRVPPDTACPVLCHSQSGPLAYLRECGAAGSASGQTACPCRPTLRQSQSRHGNASPLHPGCPSPPLLLVWMNVYFLFTWCRTSCRSIFHQFSFCEEAQCVYLRRHLGSPPKYMFVKKIYLFIFRGEGKRETSMYGCLSHAPYWGPGLQLSGMCPDWKLNQRPFGSQASAQSTKPHQPGPYICFYLQHHVVTSAGEK